MNAFPSDLMLFLNQSLFCIVDEKLYVMDDNNCLLYFTHSCAKFCNIDRICIRTSVSSNHFILCLFFSL